MSEQAQAQSRLSWGQFSLRSLMIVVTAFCVMLALMVVPPLLAMATAAMYMGVTGILAIAIWEGRGWIRAFSVGAIFPYLSGCLIALAIRQPFQLLVLVLVIVVVSCVSGIAAAAFHSVLARGNGKLPIPNLPFVRNWFTNDWHCEPTSSE